MLSIQTTIENEAENWASDYVCMPSQYISSPDSYYYSCIKGYADKEIDFLLENQRENGTWDTLWEWGAFSEEFAVAQNWWKSDFILTYMIYLKNFNTLK